MGEEVPENLLNGVWGILPGDFDKKSDSSQSTAVMGNKLYSVEEISDGDGFSFTVKIFDISTRKWLAPTVLGMRPIPSKGHLAIPLDSGRILIVKHNTTLSESIWFLEVNTKFVTELSKVLGGEVVAWTKVVEGDGQKPVVISGPSGVGKGTLISKLMNEFPSQFGFSVSHTTRAPREKEKDGVHYHFTERCVMENDITEGKFLETACVHGNLYGTSIEAVEAVSDVGKRCILDIDVQGARSVRSSTLEAIFIFIRPPSFEELENRLRSRGTETEEQVQKRLANARTELEQGKSPGLFDHTLVNDNLETCYQNLKEILALDTGAPFQSPLKDFIVPKCYYSSMSNQKVHIYWGTKDQGTEPATTRLELDLSMLRGGAPGRTRGLKAYVVDSRTEDLIKTNHFYKQSS